MSTDLERAIRSYAVYLDEVLPSVTADEVSSAPGLATVERPGAVQPRQPWHRRPAVVFLAAVVTVLLIALLPVVFLRGSETAVVEPPATTVPEPDAAPSVTTTLPTDASDPSVIRLAPVPDTDPVVVSTSLGDFEFVTMALPADPEFFPYNLAGTTHGPVAVDNETLWWSTDYATWHATPIGVDSGSGSPSIDDEDVVVPGETGATRLTWDGDEWVRKGSIELPQPPDQIVFGPRGSVALSGDTLYFSSDGVSFAEATRGPNLGVFWTSLALPEEDRPFGDCRATFGASTAHIFTVAATDSGFVTVTAAEHPGEDVCAPYLWFSPDGDTWDLVTLESPFGELSILDVGLPWDPIVEHDARFVATGAIDGMGVGEREEVIWVSDDALTWNRTSVEGLGGVVSVDAGELGWSLVDYAESEGLRLWLSTDALSWDGPYELPAELTVGYTVPQFAVTSDAIIAVDITEQIVVAGRLRQKIGD